MKGKLIIISLALLILSCSVSKHTRYANNDYLGHGYYSKNRKICFRQRGYISFGLSSTIYFPEPIDVHFKSFRVLANYYAEDKNNFYYCGQKIESIDRISAKVIEIENPTPYISKLFPEIKKYNRNSVNYILAVSDFYAKDKNNVYYGAKIIKDAAPENFKLLSLLYGKDNNNIFFRDNIVTEADESTFQIIAGSLAQDKNYVFLAGEVLDVINQPKILNEHYFTNNGITYYIEYLSSIDPRDKAIIDINHDEAITISRNYIKDRSSVFLKKIKLSKSPDSFQLIGEFTSKDSNYVYYWNEIISDKPDEFKINKFGYAVTKNTVFLEHKKRINNVDVATFEKINNNYYKDKKHVYFNDKIVSQVSPSTFKTLSKTWGCDDNSVVNYDSIRYDIDRKSFYIENNIAKDKNGSYGNIFKE